MNNETIGFAFKRISTEQFALLEENCKDDANVEIGISMGFGLDKENRIIQVLVKVIFTTEKKPFIILEVGCFFEIAPESFAGFKTQEGEKLIIPCGLAKHLSVLAVGTTRGVLHSKTEKTKFNKFLIPTINVNEMILEDLVL